MKFEIATTNRFEKDVKIAKKRGLDLKKLFDAVEIIADDQLQLPAKYQDHNLIGDFVGCRECHIEPDWLLVYKKEEIIKLVTLTRTGTHSDLFE